MRFDTLRIRPNSFIKKALLMLTTVLTPWILMAAADVVEPPKEFSLANWDWVSILTWVLALLVILVIARAFDIGALTEKITGKSVMSWNNINAWIAIILPVDRLLDMVRTTVNVTGDATIATLVDKTEKDE